MARLIQSATVGLASLASLASLLNDQRRRAGGAHLLAVYDWFTEDLSRPI